MALETFADAWRKVRLHIPDAPFGLVKEWTQHAYEDLVARRPWNFARKYALMVVPAARSFSMTATVGSPTLTSAALFLATDVGRQVRVAGTLPIYTIIAFTSTSSVTLDLPWQGTAGAQTLQIQGLYQTMPADFGAFVLATDPYNQRLFSWWHTQEDLGRFDPARTSSDGTPRALIAQGLSSVPATLGQVLYEWWPGPTTARTYPYYYRQQAQVLADTDPLLGVVTSRVLESGALAYGAAWPGTPERKNPYFNLPLHLKLKDAFEHECAKLELRDDDQAQQSWVSLPYHRWSVWGLGDTTYLRSTDASVSDYRAIAF